MRPGWTQYWMECDSERVGCGGEPGAGKRWMYRNYRKLRAFVVFVFHFLAWESTEGKGDIRGTEWTCVVINERMGKRLC